MDCRKGELVVHQGKRLKKSQKPKPDGGLGFFILCKILSLLVIIIKDAIKKLSQLPPPEAVA